MFMSEAYDLQYIKKTSRFLRLFVENIHRFIFSFIRQSLLTTQHHAWTLHYKAVWLEMQTHHFAVFVRCRNAIHVVRQCCCCASVISSIEKGDDNPRHRSNECFARNANKRGAGLAPGASRVFRLVANSSQGLPHSWVGRHAEDEQSNRRYNYERQAVKVIQQNCAPYRRKRLYVSAVAHLGPRNARTPVGSQSGQLFYSRCHCNYSRVDCRTSIIPKGKFLGSFSNCPKLFCHDKKYFKLNTTNKSMRRNIQNVFRKGLKTHSRAFKIFVWILCADGMMHCAALPSSL